MRAPLFSYPFSLNNCTLIATQIGVRVLDSLKFTTQVSKVEINYSFNMANEVYIVSAVRTPIGKHYKYNMK